MKFATGVTLLQFSGDLRCGCAPHKYCSPVEQQQKLVARGLRDSCIGLQTCDVFEQPTPELQHVGVVDLDTNVRDRFAMAGLHGGVPRMKRLIKCHRSVQLEFCQTDSTALSCMCFCSQTSANSMCTTEIQENRGTKT